MKTREQAEQRAMELFPKVPLFHNNYVSNQAGRIGFLQCYDELFKTKDLSQTCGFCVKGKDKVEKDNQLREAAEKCPTCNGSGGSKDHQGEPCVDCNGAGQ